MPWRTRVLYAAFLICLLALPLAAPVNAARPAAPAHEVILAFDVIAVKGDESVTIRTKNFPVRTKFQVLMGRAEVKPFEGEVVEAEWNSTTGGKQEITLSIPEALKGRRILAVRLVSKDGYRADNWFFNRDQAAPADQAIKPELAFTQVEKNTSVTVTGKNLMPNAAFRVRVGPYSTFYRDYATLPSVTSAADGTISFQITLPEKAKDAENIMVRLDSGANYVYNVFQNVDGGGVVAQKDLVKVVPCQVVMTNPIPAKRPGEEFDVIWTVQNSSPWNWKVNTVDVKFTGGTAMHKYEDIFDINWEVWRGSVFRITIDMIAPEQPGWYTTQWSIVQNNNTLCNLNVWIAVTDAP